MATELKFDTHTARWTDDDGDEHDHEVTAAIVEPSNLYIKERNERGEIVTLPRQVTLRDGSAHTLRVGEVVVATDRPGTYDVMPAALWATTGYGGAEVVPPSGIPARTVGDLAATPAPVASGELTEVLQLLRTLALSANASNGLQATQESTPPPVIADAAANATDAQLPPADAHSPAHADS